MVDTVVLSSGDIIHLPDVYSIGKIKKMFFNSAKSSFTVTLGSSGERIKIKGFKSDTLYDREYLSNQLQDYLARKEEFKKGVKGNGN